MRVKEGKIRDGKQRKKGSSKWEEVHARKVKQIEKEELHRVKAGRERERASGRSFVRCERADGKESRFLSDGVAGGQAGREDEGKQGGGGGKRGSKEVFAVRERSRREKQEGGVKGLIFESYRPSSGLKKVEVEGW